MSSQKSTYARVTRRETHSPRSGLAITLAVILVVVLAWIGTETVLAMLNQPALLVAPVDMGRSIVDLATYQTGLVLAGGIVVAIIGLVLVIAALGPGRRSRHVLPSGRSAVVVDNAVIASALAREASYAGNVDPDNTEVSVSHRTALVRIRPSSGQSIDKPAIRSAVASALDRYEATPKLRAKVTVDKEAKVGA